jgi:hypothetical protein
MHDGCTGPSVDGKTMVDKVRMMGFNRQPLPRPLAMACVQCEASFTMDTFECACPGCGMVYGVTPCSAHDPAKVKAAGIGY